MTQAASRRDADPEFWNLCLPGGLYDFHRSDLGRAEDRDGAETVLYAHSFDIRDETEYLLQGDVEILRADQRVAAALMRYDPKQEQWHAEGQVQYQDEGMLMEAREAHGSFAEDRAELQALRYQLLSMRGNGEAELAFNQGDGSRLKAVTYSTCDPDNHYWRIRAGRIDIDHAKGMATARNATLRLGSIPVLYMPIASFPIDDRRKTGFLFPSLGASRQRGTDLSLPYYLNLAPNYDATITPRLMSKRGVMLGAQFRYMSRHHRGEVSGSWLHNDRRTGRDRGTVTWEHRGRLSPNWRLVSNINQISDDRYFEDFGDALSIAATSLLESQIGLHGYGHGWDASLAVQGWTIADPHVPDSAEPFRRLPRALFNWERPLGSAFVAGLNSEGVLFEHRERPGALRVDLHPYLGWRYERAAGFVRAQAGVRHTRYRLDGDYLERFEQRTPSRTTPIFSLDSGLIFERPARWFGVPALQTLEPRLYYLRVPYRDQSALPIFDTQELGFGWGQLFRSNRFAGADRQSDANQATVAITTRFFDESKGIERLSASLGQIRHFSDQRVQMPGIAPVDRSGSAYVADADVLLTDRWSVGASQQWDPDRRLSDLSALRAQYRWRSGGVANFAYRFRRDARTGASDRVSLEQLDLSALIPINERWRMIGRWNYSLKDRSVVEAFGGIEWENCCLATRILLRRYVRTFESEHNTSLYVELELKGLSALGRKSGELLERAILGYAAQRP